MIHKCLSMQTCNVNYFYFNKYETNKIYMFLSRLTSKFFFSNCSLAYSNIMAHDFAHPFRCV